MKRLLAIAIGLFVFQAQSGFAQVEAELKALRKDVESLKENQLLIRRELETITELLRGRQAPPAVELSNVVVNVNGHPSKGDNNAPLTLIEFSDYQCPFCARHFSETLPQLEKDYIKTGKLKYVFRDFPMEAIHRDAVKAAEAARCAGEQGHYWGMHHRLFGNSEALALEHLSGHAKSLCLDVANFDECLDTLRYAGEVRKSFTEGVQVGVRGTPTFFLGQTAPDGSVKARRVMRGAQRYPVFKEAIEAMLSSPQQ
jgi:protein-disulfide isomerase